MCAIIRRSKLILILHVKGLYMSAISISIGAHTVSCSFWALHVGWASHFKGRTFLYGVCFTVPLGYTVCQHSSRLFFFFFFFLGETSTIGGCFLRLFCGFVVPGAPEGSTGRRFLGEARDRTCDPWFTRRVT